MEVERVTPWPRLYENEPAAWDIPTLDAEADGLWNTQARGKFYLLLPITIRRKPFKAGLSTAKRQQLAQIIACISKEKTVFDRQNNCYRIGGWSVGDWTTVAPLFSVERRQGILSVLNAFSEAMNRVLLVVQQMVSYAMSTRPEAEKRHLETSA